jgi:hypothetical protein
VAVTVRLLLAHEARARLAALAAQHNASGAELSRIIGKSDAYMGRYLSQGSPYELVDADRRRLARYFGVHEDSLRPLPPWRPGLRRRPKAQGRVGR